MRGIEENETARFFEVVGQCMSVGTIIILQGAFERASAGYYDYEDRWL